MNHKLVGQVGNLRPIGNRPVSIFRVHNTAEYQSAAGYQPAPHRRLPNFSLLCVAFLLAAGLWAGDPSETHHVTAVRFWSLGDVTRIAVETDGQFVVRSDRLDNPIRLFYDLVGTKPSLGSKAMTVIPVSDRLLRQIRIAETQHNVTRIVLDLEGTAEATTSRLEDPNRLIIELRTPGAAASKALAKPPVEAEVVRRPFTPPPARSVVADPPQRRPQLTSMDPPPAVASASVVPSPAMNLNPAPVAANPPAKPVVPPATPAETALPAKRNASGDRSMIRVLGLKVGRIVIDPGHGGHDVGTTGPEGLREKDLVLDVSRRLGELIEERLGSEVIFTRADDTFVSLSRRTAIANDAKADLFLSIHANSSTLRSAAGVETYYLNFTTSKSALEVAARENAGSQKTIFELQDLLEKIALKDKVEESREFASRIQSSLFSVSVKNDAHARDRGVKKAPFVVLIGASMPSVLAEIGFISNARDEGIMKRSEYRQRLAEALYKGLASYASTLSHFQVAQRH
ncbi:MAG TPA: N-acetylmuramoyl-L-alanine amidase [Bryobacteraceae bacterium]